MAPLPAVKWTLWLFLGFSFVAEKGKQILGLKDYWCCSVTQLGLHCGAFPASNCIILGCFYLFILIARRAGQLCLFI